MVLLVRIGIAAVMAGTAVAKDVRLAVVPPGLISPFHVQVDAGAQAAAGRHHLGLLHPSPPRETDFAEQVRIVEDLITQKLDAISVCAIGNEAIVPAVRKANAAHIPFFIHNSLEPLPGGEVTAYIGYNQRKGARLMGEYAVRALKGRGTILILEGIPGYHTRERTAGFREGLELEKHPGIVIAGSQPADWERGKAMAVTENMLQRRPDLALVFGCSDEMALGAAAAAKAHRKHGMVFLGIDGNPNAIAAIKAGDMTATLGVYPRKMGAAVVDTMLKHLAGRTVPRTVETPMDVVTRQNAETYLQHQ